MGKDQSAHDLQLMAHELTHTIQQGAVKPGQGVAAVARRAPAIQRGHDGDEEKKKRKLVRKWRHVPTPIVDSQDSSGTEGKLTLAPKQGAPARIPKTLARPIRNDMQSTQDNGGQGQDSDTKATKTKAAKTKAVSQGDLNSTKWFIVRIEDLLTMKKDLPSAATIAETELPTIKNRALASAIKQWVDEIPKVVASYLEQSGISGYNGDTGGA